MGFYQREQMWGFMRGNSCGVLPEKTAVGFYSCGILLEGTAVGFYQREQLWVLSEGTVVREQLWGLISRNSCGVLSEGTVVEFYQREQS